jgi:hypothetical protein
MYSNFATHIITDGAAVISSSTQKSLVLGTTLSSDLMLAEHPSQPPQTPNPTTSPHRVIYSKKQMTAKAGLFVPSCNGSIFCNCTSCTSSLAVVTTYHIEDRRIRSPTQAPTPMRTAIPTSPRSLHPSINAIGTVHLKTHHAAAFGRTTNGALTRVSRQWTPH